MPGFQETWNEDHNHVEPYQVLHHKLKKTSIRLNALFSNAEVQLHMALKIIICLDIGQESRTLSPAELDHGRRLKRRVVGLVMFEKARNGQNSRITNIKGGDANTRFFHLRVNRCERKKYSPPKA